MDREVALQANAFVFAGCGLHCHLRFSAGPHGHCDMIESSAVNDGAQSQQIKSVVVLPYLSNHGRPPVLTNLDGKCGMPVVARLP